MIITDDITIISVNPSADNEVAGGKCMVCGQIHQKPKNKTIRKGFKKVIDFISITLI